MNALRMTAAVGAFAFLCPTAHAQGLLSQLFNFPQATYPSSNLGGIAAGNSSACSPCGPNGCQAPAWNPGAVSPTYRGNSNSTIPYFSNGSGNFLPGNGRPGMNNSFPGFSVQQNNFPRPAVPYDLNARPNRVPGSSFDTMPTPRGNQPDLHRQLGNPMFTGTFNTPSIPVNSMPMQQNGWTLY